MQTQKNNIVYIEDEPKIFLTISSLLSEFFPSLKAFDHPKKYIEALENGLQPDLIVTDITLPYMNGFELLAFAKTNFGINVPVIITSGNPKLNHEDDLKDINLSEFIQKPLNIRTLLEAINKEIQ